MSAAPKDSDDSKKAASSEARPKKKTTAKAATKKSAAPKAPAKKTAPKKAAPKATTPKTAAPKKTESKKAEVSKKVVKKAPAAKPKEKKSAATKKPVDIMPELELHNLRPPAGAVKAGRRLGQGPGSGRGKTAGRGHKGQKSRSGYSRKPGFEGGQMPLHRRLPKRGFTNIFRKEYTEVNVGRLAGLKGEKEITPELLLHKRVINKLRDGVKILGHGEVNEPLVVRAHAFSAAARTKIEAAGGKAEVIAK